MKLKQPTKYIDTNLQQQKSSEFNELQKVKGQNQYHDKKTKQIVKTEKNTYSQKKLIKKKHEPSSLRLQKINQTFENIYNNSDHLFNSINIDRELLQKLVSQKQKGKCYCNKNVKYYCLKCMTKVTELQFPEVKLPLTLNIVHHQSQKINKSSALPIKFLSEQARFLFYSSNSESTNKKLWQELPVPNQQTWILFPHKDSKPVSQIANLNSVKNLIVLDCTWFQTDILIEEFQSKGYTKFVSLQKQHPSIYWRYNHHNQSALSSVQAISYFMRQRQQILFQKEQNKKANISTIDSSDIKTDQKPQAVHKHQNQANVVQKQAQIKKYDNLLFLYALNLRLIIRQEQNRLKKHCLNDQKE